jgi:SAM-dependent methyltransferase
LPNNEISIIYDAHFYHSAVRYEKRSSLSFAKIVQTYLKPKSVVDVGCGCGIYLKAFSLVGVKELLGIDGSEHAIKESFVPGKIILHDLRTPLRIKKKFDLCLCMEVAEHIEFKYAELLVDNLIKLSDKLLFTAALPGQGGRNHINEQPHSFWIKLFGQRGFYLKKELTKRLKQDMEGKNVIWWVPQNLMLFERAEKIEHPKKTTDHLKKKVGLC